MVQTLFAKNISLHDLEEQFGLQLTDDQFFTEFSRVTTASTPEHSLERVKTMSRYILSP